LRNAGKYAKLYPFQYKFILSYVALKDIEPVSIPFANLVNSVGIDYEMLVKEAERLKNAGIM